MQEWEVVLKDTRKTIEAGKVVGVLGWPPRFHDDLTRLVPASKFLFWANFPRSVPPEVGYVVRTKEAPRDLVVRLRKEGLFVSNLGLSKEEVRRLVRDIVPELTPMPTLLQPREEVPDMSSSLENEPDQKVSAPLEVKNFPETMEESRRAFSFDFLQMTNGMPEKPLSKYEVSLLLVTHFGEKGKSPKKHSDLIEPVTSPGDVRAGSYQATALLLDLALSRSETEPKDPVEKLRWLVARRPLLIRKMSKLDDEEKVFLSRLANDRAEISNEIRRCDKADEILAEMMKV
ncbi:MAG: hypothetical protein JWL80_259 [Parcubacteria group bacterium]|nr:hypothetical protein [Parcubacteria group bacterium]